MSKIIVTFSFNNDYVSYGKLLCKSIIESGSNVKVFARCVNVDIKNIKNLKKLYPKFTFFEDNRILDKEKKFLKNEIPKNENLSPIYNKELRKYVTKNKNYNVTKFSEESVYTCHSRFLNILKILKDEPKNTIILCIDVDTIFKNRINEDILNDMINCNLMIYKNINGEYNEEGCFILKNSDKINLLFENLNKIIQNDFLNWDIDGYAFKKLLTKNKTIKIKQLDISKYKDKKLTDKSLLWSGDSHVKNNLKFR
ncbi:MAG: hypothetical protein CML17_01775 [Pusillimonas sp.]|nr:hypothetical protein [Pusillimonas sp.]